jgi:hypothetical protein
MPLLKNQEEWETWLKENAIGIHCAIDGGEPHCFPCWLIAIYHSSDCHDDTYLCSFIYKDSSGEWDLGDYEERDGWG